MLNVDAAKKEVIEWIAAAVQSTPDAIDLDRPLPDLGLDSNDAVHLVCTVEAVLRTELPEDIMSRVSNTRDILRLIDQHADQAPSAAAG